MYIVRNKIKSYFKIEGLKNYLMKEKHKRNKYKKKKNRRKKCNKLKEFPIDTKHSSTIVSSSIIWNEQYIFIRKKIIYIKYN